MILPEVSIFRFSKLVVEIPLESQLDVSKKGHDIIISKLKKKL